MTTDDFYTWAASNYPMLAMAQNASNGAAAKAAAAAAAIDGPAAAQIGQYLSKLNIAESTNSSPGYVLSV